LFHKLYLLVSSLSSFLPPQFFHPSGWVRLLHWNKSSVSINSTKTYNVLCNNHRVTIFISKMFKHFSSLLSSHRKRIISLKDVYGKIVFSLKEISLANKLTKRQKFYSSGANVRNVIKISLPADSFRCRCNASRYIIMSQITKLLPCMRWKDIMLRLPFFPPLKTI
jgi:hypothetical protein